MSYQAILLELALIEGHAGWTRFFGSLDGIRAIAPSSLAPLGTPRPTTDLLY